MTNVLSNPSFDDATRREHLYGGDVMVYGASPATLALVEFTRGLVEEAFGELDPQTAQHHMQVEDFAALLADLKPRFIHHPRCKELRAAACSTELRLRPGAHVLRRPAAADLDVRTTT